MRLFNFASESDSLRFGCVCAVAVEKPIEIVAKAYQRSVADRRQHPTPKARGRLLKKLDLTESSVVVTAANGVVARHILNSPDLASLPPVDRGEEVIGVSYDDVIRKPFQVRARSLFSQFILVGCFLSTHVCLLFVC